MSQENVEALVRRNHEAFNRKDRDAFIAAWDEECEYQPAMERDMAGDEDAFRGHGGIRRWWQGMLDAWSEWESEVHEVRSSGDQVLVSLTLRARGRESGAEIEAPFFQVARFRAGKIVVSRDYSDRDRALEAAGLEK